nr:helix-turn-helix domain-containing protein [uncultured Holophaga sp.]
MPSPSLRQEIHRVLVHYFEDLEQVMRSDSLARSLPSILADAGLRPEDLRTEGRLSFEHYLAALQSLDNKGLIPGLGLRLGALKRCGTYGFTGIAFLTQGTLAQVHAFAIQAFSICFGHLLSLCIEREGDWLCSRYDAAPTSLGHFTPLIEQVMVTGYRTFSEVLPGKDWSACRAHFIYPAPPHAALYGQHLPFPCLFGQARNELCLPASWGEESSMLAEDHIRAFCSTHFQAMLERGLGSGPLTTRVRGMLAACLVDQLPRLPEIARQLHLTERSLRAHLAQEGSSFRTLLNEALLEHAKTLLVDRPDLSIKEIAFRLGFAQPSSLNRAFAKATGCTPLAFRDSGGSPPGRRPA